MEGEIVLRGGIGVRIEMRDEILEQAFVSIQVMPEFLFINDFQQWYMLMAFIIYYSLIAKNE